MVSGWSLISRHFNDCRRLGIRKTKTKKLNMARRRWCTSVTATFALCCTLIAHHDELVKVVGATAITTASTASDLPNVVLIVTDDQDVVLNGMMPMAKTQKLLANEGATFANAFTSSPLCCPSRASILSGQYAHNHATINNSLSGGCYGTVWREHIEPRTVPVQLQKRGYRTFYAGKYLNKYEGHEVPPGYSDWHGLHGNSKYYNYTLNENGQLKSYGDREEDYLTDVIRDKALDFLKKQTPDTPFFAMLSPPAPHEPFTAAKRHLAAFKNINALRTPNFNVAARELEKHWLVRMPPAPLPQTVLDTIDLYYRQRWQTLLAVDDMVEALVEQLNSLNLYENTYIVFTSDNGYHLGQFSMPYDKRQPYETDIRVPFIVVGPNVRPKILVDQPIALIDLAPTIFHWAKIDEPSWLDGESFASSLGESNDANVVAVDSTETSIDVVDCGSTTERQDVKYERKLLVQYWGEGTPDTYNPECPWQKSDMLSLCALDAACHCTDAWNNTYSCIRHLANDLDKLYCEFYDAENFVEAYDINSDPHQINNIGYDMLPSERSQYSLMLDKLKRCQDESCRRI